MQAAFVILFDLDIYNYARKLQVKLYDLFGTKETLKLDPHITIKYAFDASKLNDYEKYFDELVKATPPFEIEINRVDSFETNVVYLGISKSKILTDLHLKVLHDFKERFSIEPSEFEGENLNFHATLAYKDITEEVFGKIKEYLKNEKPNFKFQVRKLGLYLRFNENDNWFVYKVGELK